MLPALPSVFILPKSQDFITHNKIFNVLWIAFFATVNSLAVVCYNFVMIHNMTFVSNYYLQKHKQLSNILWFGFQS